jgi:hypothetical protein
VIRPVFTELALFLTPFVLYAVFLLATRAGVLHPESWSWRVLGWLTLAALGMVIGSFLIMAEFSGAPKRSTYTPAHMEGGRLVPGEAQ